MPAKPPPVVPGSTKSLCPHCGKRVRRHGLIDHVAAMHAAAPATA
jgi:hypothetical protein